MAGLDTPGDEESRRQRRREIFQKYDRDNSGDINLDEFHFIMDELGVHKPCDELRAIVKIATQGSATPQRMTFEQFDLLFATSRLKDIFNSLDKDKSGSLSRVQVKEALQRAGELRTEEEIDAMISTIDTNKNNEIDFEEFRSFFEYVPLASLSSVASHWRENSALSRNMAFSAEELKRRAKRREVFHRYDKNKFGYIGISEFGSIMHELGVNKSVHELEEIVAVATKGTTAPTVMTFDQFDNLFSTSRLRDAFDEMDENKTGSIDVFELHSVMQKFGHKITQRQCWAMIKKIDRDNNNEIDFEEFRSFFENLPLASMTSIANHWGNSVLVTDIGADMAPTVHSDGTGLYWWQTVLAGGSAGILSRTLTAPLEKIKITAQTGLDGGRGVAASLRHVFVEQGVRGLFAGNLLNCIRVFPTAGITCTIYLNLLALTPSDKEFDAMEPIYHLTCAGTAGVVGNTLTYPMDLLRTRVTVLSKQTSIIYQIKDIFKSAGVAGFFHGIQPTLLAVVPFVALQNTAIDLLRDEAMQRGISPSPSMLLCIGAFSGILAQSVVYPLDVLRRRMQLQHSGVSRDANIRVVSDKTWLAMRNVVKMHGVRSLYSGIVPTYLKTIPAIGVVSLVSNTINSFFRELNKSAQVESLITRSV